MYEILTIKSCNKLRQTLSLATTIKSVAWSESISYTEISGRKEGFQRMSLLQEWHWFEVNINGIDWNSVPRSNFLPTLMKWYIFCKECDGLLQNYSNQGFHWGRWVRKSFTWYFGSDFFPYQTNKQAFQSVSKGMTEEVTGKRREQPCNTFLSVVTPPKKQRDWIWNSCPPHVRVWAAHKGKLEERNPFIPTQTTQNSAPRKNILSRSVLRFNYWTH